MAGKKYMIHQSVTSGGRILTSSFSFFGEEQGLQNFLALLEGGYRVTEENAALTNMAGADNEASTFLKCTKIGLTSEADAGGNKTFANIKPFKGGIMFKHSVDPVAIESALLNVHAFPIAPTLKVAQVYANTSAEGTGNGER